MAAGKLQRIAQRVRKAEAVHEAETKRHQPAPLEPGPDNIFDRHVYDGSRNQDLDQRRKPERIWRVAECRRGQRDGMGDRKRRHDADERTDAAHRNDQAQQKEQMINAVEQMADAHRDESRRRMPPGWVELHLTGVTKIQIRPLDTVGSDEA